MRFTESGRQGEIDTIARDDIQKRGRCWQVALEVSRRRKQNEKCESQAGREAQDE